jgi:hypothetical protein
MPNRSHLGSRLRQRRTRDLEKHERTWLIHFKIGHVICGDLDQDDPRIVWAAVAIATLVLEPCFPIGLVKFSNSRSIGVESGCAANGDPFL